MTAPAQSSSITELANQVAALKKEVEDIKEDLRTASLGNSSIENGSIKAYDQDGTPRQTIGRQNDGSFAVTYANGVAPPQPTAPICVAGELAITVYWDGTLLSPKPADFARVDIHMSKDPNFVPSSDTLYSSLLVESATTIPMSLEQWYVKLVGVSSSDVASAPSTTVPVKPNWATHIGARVIDSEQLNTDIVLSSNIYAGDPNAGQYVKITPSGLYVFDSTNKIKALFQGEDVMVSGEIRTADAGERLVLNEADAGDPSLHFYPDVGDSFSEIRSRTVTSTVSGVPNATTIEMRSTASLASKSRNINFVVDPSIPATTSGTTPAFNFSFAYADGTINPNSTCEFVQWGSDGSFLLRNTAKDLGLLWGTDFLRVSTADGNGRKSVSALHGFYTGDISKVTNIYLGNNNGSQGRIYCDSNSNDAYIDFGPSYGDVRIKQSNGGWRDCYAWQFLAQKPSWRRMKTDLRTSTDYFGKSALDIVTNLDVRAFRYDTDAYPEVDDHRQQYGLILDELPKELIHETDESAPDHHKTWDHAEMISLALDAIKDLAQQVASLRGAAR